MITCLYDNEFYVDAHPEGGFFIGAGMNIAKRVGKVVDTYRLIPARLLGMDYVDYLIFAAKEYNATLVKNTNDVYARFEKESDANALRDLLNKEWWNYEDKK